MITCSISIRLSSFFNISSRMPHFPPMANINSGRHSIMEELEPFGFVPSRAAGILSRNERYKHNVWRLSIDENLCPLNLVFSNGVSALVVHSPIPSLGGKSYVHLRAWGRNRPQYSYYITLHYVISYANYTYSDQWCINKVIQVLRMRA